MIYYNIIQSGRRRLGRASGTAFASLLLRLLLAIFIIVIIIINHY